ncbi:MAG: hypothetical protein HRT89_02180 [Lentisphaeria bacterium]|nr:hypothetical protein [Lentisphaeria bacterium]NQZ66855.1 hypothetical protein [Lentisphaeria bacterium]
MNSISLDLSSAISSNHNALTTKFGELASGQRSSSEHSPALLQIGERLLNQAKRSNMANQNIQSAMSRSHTVDACLADTNDSITRLKELAVRSGDGTMTDADRESLNTEAQEIIKHISLNNRTANYNGKEILQGGDVKVAVSPDGESVSLSTPDLSLSELGLDDLDLRDMSNIDQAIESLDAAGEKVSQHRSTLGAEQNMMKHRYGANMDAEVALREAGSKQVDTDFARALTEMSSAGVRSNIAIAVQAQGTKILSSAMATLL